MSDFDDDAYGPCPPPNSENDIKVEEDREEDRLSVSNLNNYVLMPLFNHMYLEWNQSSFSY